MTFIKKIWKNYPDTSTPITADELNRIEDGIMEALESGGSSGYTDIYSENSINYGRALIDDEPQIPGKGSVAFGDLLVATGIYSHAEGINNKATNTGSHAEGSGNEATGMFSHAEGGNTKANGQSSHAEGMSTSTDPSAMASHAEGSGSKANSMASHAEGYQTETKGFFSHAEGMNTITNDIGSHAEGLGTIAFESYQHVEGRYNKTESASVPLLKVIGNGTSDTERSNAHTLDMEGNAWYAGDVQNGAGDKLSEKIDMETIYENSLYSTGKAPDPTPIPIEKKLYNVTWPHNRDWYCTDGIEAISNSPFLVSDLSDASALGLDEYYGAVPSQGIHAKDFMMDNMATWVGIQGDGLSYEGSGVSWADTEVWLIPVNGDWKYTNASYSGKADAIEFRDVDFSYAKKGTLAYFHDECINNGGFNWDIPGVDNGGNTALVFSEDFNLFKKYLNVNVNWPTTSKDYTYILLSSLKFGTGSSTMTSMYCAGITYMGDTRDVPIDYPTIEEFKSILGTAYTSGASVIALSDETENDEPSSPNGKILMVPEPPKTNGKYMLVTDVSDGKLVFSWINYTEGGGGSPIQYDSAEGNSF